MLGDISKITGTSEPEWYTIGEDEYGVESDDFETGTNPAQLKWLKDLSGSCPHCELNMLDAEVSYLSGKVKQMEYYMFTAQFYVISGWMLRSKKRYYVRSLESVSDHREFVVMTMMFNRNKKDSETVFKWCDSK